MKTLKTVTPKRVFSESQCHKRYKSRIFIEEKNNFPKTSKQNVCLKKCKGLYKLESGEGKKSLTFKRKDFSKENVVNQTIKPKNEKNEKLKQKNVNNKNKTNISSKLVFSRKFSKYNDVQHKLKIKFKSSFKNSGRFDHNSTKYKSYINQNKKKSFIKFSTCSLGFNKELKKKRKTVLCSDLPGKGTYNHRFAYDEALQLHKQNIDVDVLYKVKTKTDSIYIINGEFLWAKNKQSDGTRKLSKNNSIKEQTKPQDLIEEEALWLEELAKIKEINDKRKSRLALLSEIKKAKAEREKKQRHEEFIRKKNMREIEKKIRTEQLNKLFNLQILNEKKLKEEKMNRKLHDKKKKQQIIDEQKQLEDERLRRLQLQQNIALKYKNNRKNKLNIEQVIKIENINDEIEIIKDPNTINDIKLWALKNENNMYTISWLKIVTRRIDLLDKRISTFCKNKWMRMAIDKVVDTMTGKKRSSDFSKDELSNGQSSMNKTLKDSSSCVMKTKRTTKCRKPTVAIGIRKSPKFSICPGANTSNLYKIVKTKQNSYFQLINVDAFGYCKERTTN